MAPIMLFSDSDFHSPYVMSVYVALLEKGLPFALHTVDLAAGLNRQAPFSQASLTARVPMLQVGEFCLTESSAIIEYLEDIAPNPPLLPRDVQQRARARQIQAWLRSDLVPLRIERATTVIFDVRNPAPLSEAAQAAADKLLCVADDLICPQQAHLFDTWSVADADLALMLNRLVANGDPVPEKIRHYVQQQWQRPSIQQWVALSSATLSTQLASWADLAVHRRIRR